MGFGDFAKLVPLIRAFVVEAESSNASGEQKKEAVMAAIAAAWPEVQRRIKELRGIDIEDYAEEIGVVIDSVVTLLNSLFGKVWSWIERVAIDPLETWIDVDLDRDGDVGGVVKETR